MKFKILKCFVAVVKVTNATTPSGFPQPGIVPPKLDFDVTIFNSLLRAGSNVLKLIRRN